MKKPKSKPKSKPKKKPSIKKASRPAINMQGLSLDDVRRIYEQSGGKLTKNDLMAINNKLRSAANKRLTRLEKSGMAKRSFVYRERQRTRYKKGGKYGKKGEVRLHHRKAKRFAKKKNATRNQLLSETSKLLNFLNKQSSTVQGTKEILESFKKQIGYFENDDQLSDFFDLYHKMLEEFQIDRTRRDEFYMNLRKKFYNALYPGGIKSDPDTLSNYENAMKQMRDYIDSNEFERDEILNETELNSFQELEDEDEENWDLVI